MKYKSTMPTEQFSWVKNTFNGDTVVRWNRIDKTVGDDTITECDEMVLRGTPTLQMIKNRILDEINKDTDSKILSGFVWNAPDTDAEINVWLSEENQFNYKAVYDLAVQTQGASLPFKLKFGATDSPQYYTFTDLATFADFYVKSIQYINATIEAGWQQKDSIDWSVYGVNNE